MKVLISGAGGFIGKNLAEQLSSKYEVLAPSRAELDLLSKEKVSAYLSEHSPDALVHAAAVGVSRAQSAADASSTNLKMFENVFSCSRHYGKLIQLGSGAEYDRRRPLARVKEEEFGLHVPSDEYGSSKYKCSKLIEKHAKTGPNAVCLRIFGCYGKYEDYSARFISNNLCRALFKRPVLISNINALFDYLYIDDLARIVSHFIDAQEHEHAFYNATPDESVELLALAKKINALYEDKPGIMVRHEGMGPAYTGDNARLRKELGQEFKFTSIDEGIGRLNGYYAQNMEKIDPTRLGPSA